MKKLILYLMSIILATVFTRPSVHAQQTRNPIIWADVPDLAMIRVGDTYYMSSTTAHMSPGLPIMKSKDLVNWEMVSYAYDTLGDNDALTLQNGKNAYGAGSWASSLRYHNGTFYATTFSGTTGKTYIYTTKDIEKGPWTETSFSPSLHDHSLFFDDDGRVYMLYGGGNLRLTELNADLSGIKPGGFDEVVVPNASAVAGPNIGLPAEGSQLLKHDGKYYLFNISWPRGGMRTVLVHRADKITGPYEGRVALQDKGVAQGSLIDTPQGEWFAYLFRDYGAVGRVPYLVPVKWENGWPILGVDGKVPDTLNLPLNMMGTGGVAGIVASDDFKRSPGQPRAAAGVAVESQSRQHALVCDQASRIFALDHRQSQYRYSRCPQLAHAAYLWPAIFGHRRYRREQYEGWRLRWSGRISEKLRFCGCKNVRRRQIHCDGRCWRRLA